jgi:hypothetical protein
MATSSLPNKGGDQTQKHRKGMGDQYFTAKSADIPADASRARSFLRKMKTIVAGEFAITGEFARHEISETT